MSKSGLSDRTISCEYIMILDSENVNLNSHTPPFLSGAKSSSCRRNSVLDVYHIRTVLCAYQRMIGA